MGVALEPGHLNHAFETLQGEKAIEALEPLDKGRGRRVYKNIEKGKSEVAAIRSAVAALVGEKSKRESATSSTPLPALHAREGEAKKGEPPPTLSFEPTLLARFRGWIEATPQSETLLAAFLDAQERAAGSDLDPFADDDDGDPFDAPAEPAETPMLQKPEPAPAPRERDITPRDPHPLLAFLRGAGQDVPNWDDEAEVAAWEEKRARRQSNEPGVIDQPGRRRFEHLLTAATDKAAPAPAPEEPSERQVQVSGFVVIPAQVPWQELAQDVLGLLDENGGQFADRVAAGLKSFLRLCERIFNGLPVMTNVSTAPPRNPGFDLKADQLLWDELTKDQALCWLQGDLSERDRRGLSQFLSLVWCEPVAGALGMLSAQVVQEQHRSAQDAARPTHPGRSLRPRRR